MPGACVTIREPMATLAPTIAFRPELWVLDGAGFFGSIFLILLLLAMLPADRRGLIRLPLSLLGVFVVSEAVRLFAPVEPALLKPVRVIGLFAALVASARSLVLLLFSSRLTMRWAAALPAIFKDIFQVLLYLGAVMGTLRAAGLEPSSLLTTSAVLTAVVGLSLQETLGNLFSGLAIQAQRPFEVGDWVQFDADNTAVGQVIEISWRATKVLTLDRVEIIVPNATIAKSALRNFTKPTPTSRRTIRVSAAYAMPPAKVKAALAEAVVGIPHVLTTPAPLILLTEYADSGINYEIRYFTDDFRLADITDATVRERIWYALGRAGVSIPFPQVDVHMSHVTDETKKAEAARAIDRRDLALRYVNLFDLLPATLHRQLAERSHVRLYAPGETIIRQGEPGSELFVVLEGEVTILVSAGERTSAEVARLAKGEFFGEMSLMTGQARTATVRAAEPTEVLVVPHEPFKDLLGGRPELIERLSLMLAQRKLELEQRNSKESEWQRASREDETSKEILVRIRQFFKL